MKKYFLIVLLIGFFGVSFAQKTGNSWTLAENYVQPGEVKIITQDLKQDTVDDLQNIKLNFCNEFEDKNIVTRNLKLEMRPWQSKEICVVLSNEWDKTLNIFLWFSSGTVNDAWNMICDDDMTTKNIFSRYILQVPTTGIIVPNHGNVIRKVKYVAPKNSSGNIVWCAVYKLNQEEKIEPGKMFLIVVRKVGYIQINIVWSVYQFWRWDNFKDFYAINKAGILKVIIAILVFWIIVTILQTTKKKEKHHGKK